jgi:hypothetical protein
MAHGCYHPSAIGSIDTAAVRAENGPPLGRDGQRRLILGRRLELKAERSQHRLYRVSSGAQLGRAVHQIRSVDAVPVGLLRPA